jgi:tRNA A-37 threonylcarbamoyl transferase component Bud32
MKDFEVVREGSATFFLRPDCRSWLLEPLRREFSGLDRTPVQGRTRHYSVEAAGRKILVRFPTRGGFWSFLGRRHLGLSRVRREAQALRLAAEAGLSVPELLAVRVDSSGIFRKLTCVYPYLEGVQTLDRRLADLRGPERWDLLRKVAGLVLRMHRAGLLHGDLNVRNVLIRGSEIILVDFDGARLRGRGGHSEIYRLCRSLEKTMRGSMMATDKARLVRAYIDPKWLLKPSLARCEKSLARHRCWWKFTSSGEAASEA